MAFNIGSFNMYKFGKKNSDESIKMLSRVLSEQDFDIIALQEVFDKNALRNLVNNMGRDWSYRHSIPENSSAHEAEGYAFIWNNRTMQLAPTREIKIEDGKTVSFMGEAQPHIYDKYRIDPRRGQFPLARNPFYGRFKPIACNCELRIINTHIRFGKDEDTHYADEKLMGEKQQRQNEFKILCDSIYYSVQSDRSYANNLTAYTILLGDYNLSLSRPYTKSPYLPNEYSNPDHYFIRNDHQTLDVITVQESLSTIKRQEDDNDDGNNVSKYYANNYDHFTFCADYNSIVKKAAVIDTLEKYCNYSIEKHRELISDHMPIKLTIDLREGR